jgi:hypothetical protein|tara:strand:+ start:1996 stop:2568 length:573 start_codon:yes stop_codon:yes gene_type:complete
MKTIIKLLLLLLTITGCEKDMMYPPCKPTQYTDDTTSYVKTHILDGTWEVRWGKMYMENLDTGEEEEIFLFNSGPIGSLRYEGSMYSFETVIRYQTTWTFNFPENTPDMGTFFLNGDSIHPYSLYITENNLTICEHLSGQYILLGGSSRPLTYEILDYNNKIVNFYVQETYTHINGYNYRYYSKLRLKKL